MSITAWDIKEAAFASDTKDVEELILANKGATDVGALSQAVNLRSLSLAFNALSGLSGLAPLTRLQSLNVSHNQLASLKGLQGLSCLVSLNASHNKVVSLAPLSGLRALADVWLQNNAVAAPGELRVLAELPGLQRLAVANNPVVKALPPDHVRLAALRLCPGLRLMDGRPVEPAERKTSDALDMEELLAARPAAPGSAPASTSPHAASHSGGVQRLTGQRSESGQAHSRTGRSMPSGRASNGGSGLPLLGLRLPASASRRPVRSNSYNSIPDTCAATPITLHRAREPVYTAGGDGEASPQSQLDQTTSFSSTLSPTSSPAGTRRGADARRPPLAGTRPVRPATQLEGSQFQAVLDALPRFDTSKLPARYNGAPPRPRGAASVPPAPAARPPPADAHLVEYEAKYPVQRGGGRAVVVRRDGSAAAFWPGADMAVTVDADYSTPPPPAAAASDADGSCDSGDEAAAPPLPQCSYKMMTMYRAGGVAVSWDAQGGFVQYPSGGLMLMYSRVTGSGTCYGPSGDITRRWRDPDAAAEPPPAPAIALPFPLASPRAPPAPPPPPPSHVDMQLDPHLGVRFLSASRTLELYFSCEGVRYRLRCGRNSPGEVWEPPAGRGDGAVVGRPAPSAHPEEGQPWTPGAGGECSAAAGNIGDGSGLPPPAFLRNLARQGGAGTHKTAGGGGGGTAKQGGLSSALSIARSASVDLDGIASITAGLQALTDGLQAMLARDTRNPETEAGVVGAGAPASSAAAPDLAPKPSPAKGRRATGAGSGVSAVRSLAAELEAPSGSSGAAEAVAVARGPAAVTSTLQRSDVPSGTSRSSSSSSEGHGAPTPRELLTAERNPAAHLTAGSPGRVVGTGATKGRRWAGKGGPGPPLDVSADVGAVATRLGPGCDEPGREGEDALAGGGEAGGLQRPALDSDVAAQLAAARRLAADSLAAAVAAASAAAAIGSMD